MQRNGRANMDRSFRKRVRQKIELTKKTKRTKRAEMVELEKMISGYEQEKRKGNHKEEGER